MKILIECNGSYGDVFPFIAIGRALQQRGHQIVFFANGRFESLARETGFDYVMAGTADEYETFIKDPDLWESKKGFKIIIQMLVAHLPEAYQRLAAHVEPGNTLVIGSSLAFATRLIQETHQVPGVTVHLAPSVFRSDTQLLNKPGKQVSRWLSQSLWWLVDRFVLDPAFTDEFNRFRETLGLSATSRMFRDWIHAPDLVIGLFPEWFAAPQPGWPPQVHCTGFPLLDQVDDDDLPDEVRSFLAEGTKPFVFTPGTAMRQGNRFFRASVSACQKLKARGILLSRYADQIPEKLPDGIRHFDFVPLSRLLPHAAAVIHHGGIGTSSQALRAGVPQLIRPCAYDQFDNAWHIEKLGVGFGIDREMYTPDTVVEELNILTQSPRIADRCRIIAEHFESSTPMEDTCDLIEKLMK